jgi:hypothetical protein
MLRSSIVVAVLLFPVLAHAQPTDPPASSPSPADAPPLVPPMPGSGAPPLPPEAEKDGVVKTTPAPAAPTPGPTEQAPETPFPGDYTWMNGQSRQKDFPLQINKYVTLSLYLDAYYALSTNRPQDNTFTGTASVARHNELQINLASIGAEWNYRNVIGRFSFQYGSMLNIVQDLDGTVTRGRSLAGPNMRNIREATLGYHFDVSHGLNVEAGIFMSYIGLESYLLAENWNYQRSFLSDHTPFYFQGVRAQYFPTKTVKIEPWIMNGWQTYGKWNDTPSFGTQLRWSPSKAVTLVGNFYYGYDTKNVPDRARFHHDDSILVRYFNEPASSGLSKMAFSLNSHVGFESGGDGLPGPSGAHMVGSSLVHRAWFYKDRLALSVRGELFSNPSRYLAQYPPPGLATGEGQNLRMWGLTTTFDVMPTDIFTLRAEFTHRRGDTRYFAGRSGTTSIDGFQGTPGDFTPAADKSTSVFLLSANFRL